MQQILPTSKQPSMADGRVNHVIQSAQSIVNPILSPSFPEEHVYEGEYPVKKRLHIVVTGLLLSLWAVPAAGQDLNALDALAKKAAEGDGLGKLLPVLLKEIEMTQEQNQRVAEIIASHRGKFQTLFNQLRTANQDLVNQLIVAGEIKAEDLAPQVQRITDLREQLLVEGLYAVLEVRQVLTPEQRAKAVQIKDQLQTLRNTMSGLLGEKSSQTASEEKTLSSSGNQ
jgi:Spy/CpxP family protein refolding chaperone